MNITITGPRSVGKTTISKLISEELKLKYISSDERGEKAFKKYGGLDKVIKSGKIKEIINSGGYTIILNLYNKEKNFVFDLSGGAFTSRSMKEASEEIRKVAKKNSKIVGLLPYQNNLKSIFLLFSREKRRIHFKHSSKFKLFLRTCGKYSKMKNTILKNSNLIIYTKRKSPEVIVKEIIEKLKNESPFS